MRTLHILAALGYAVWISTAASPASAREGDDHGVAPVTSAGSALPRFVAVSETFELVGVVNDKELTLYLDHYADGSPVENAKLELELGGVKVPVELHAAGVFEATLAQALKPGLISVAATVIAGAESDLLAGELDIDEEAHSDVAAHTYGWEEYALGGGTAGGVLVLLVLLIRRLRAARNARLGGAA